MGNEWISRGGIKKIMPGFGAKIFRSIKYGQKK
jgi:hypothetical protein